MSNIIPLHGLLTAGVWAWGYVKQLLRHQIQRQKKLWQLVIEHMHAYILQYYQKQLNKTADIQAYGSRGTFCDNDIFSGTILECSMRLFFYSGVRIQSTKKRPEDFCSLVMFPTVPCHSTALSFLLSLLRLRRGYQEDIFRHEQSLCSATVSTGGTNGKLHNIRQGVFSIEERRGSAARLGHSAYQQSDINMQLINEALKTKISAAQVQKASFFFCIYTLA